jgi:isoleucyl-tRNA synthetase
MQPGGLRIGLTIVALRHSVSAAQGLLRSVHPAGWRRMKSPDTMLVGGLRQIIRSRKPSCHTARSYSATLAVASFEPLPLAGMEVLERWMLARLNEVRRDLANHAGRYEFGAMVATLNQFCTDDLSAVWFNMRKDSLYCDAPTSDRRRGVATVVAQVVDHLTRWLEPLVPFTAEEAWQELRGAAMGSVHEQASPQADDEWEDPGLLRCWATVRHVRSTCLTEAERLQQAGQLRSLLEAQAHVGLPANQHAELSGVDLAALTGMSTVTAISDGDALTVVVGPAPGARCERCWQVLPEVTHGLCLRCQAV